MEITTRLMENFFASAMESPNKEEKVEKTGPTLLEKMQDARLKEAKKMVKDNRFYF